MTYKPHWRVTCSGTLGSGADSEIFSFGFALAKGEGFAGVFPALLEPNDTYFDDLAADCVAYFGATATEIHPSARLKLVKVAPIGADGKYTDAPVEKLVDQAGGAGGGRLPNQCATVVTLGTDGDIGRVKGRWYLPIPGVTLDANGMLPEGVAESIEASTATFIENVNNAPGLDVLGLEVCVASQGRFNDNGSQRVAPENWTVRRIAVGRVVDTQRRRRNKMPEYRDYTSISDPG